MKKREIAKRIIEASIVIDSFVDSLHQIGIDCDRSVLCGNVQSDLVAIVSAMYGAPPNCDGVYEEYLLVFNEEQSIDEFIDKLKAVKHWVTE